MSPVFTSIPVSDMIETVKRKLEEDSTWKHRTLCSIDNIIELFNICLNNTYFIHKRQFAIMASTVSPIVAILYTETIERRAINTAANPPSFWYRYIDDTFVQIHEYHMIHYTH